MISLIDESDLMSQSDKRELRSRLLILIAHLLKLDYLPAFRAHDQAGWQDTVREQRRGVLRLLRQHPSLRPRLAEAAVAQVYRDAVITVKREYPGTQFPKICPYTVREILRA